MTNFFHSILLSNQKHADWIQKKIIENIEDLRGKTVAILGLAYKDRNGCFKTF